MSWTGPRAARTLVGCTALAMTATIALGSCSKAAVATLPLVTLAEARAAVTRHWDVNREALRASSAAQAKQLIEEVESGDALRMDEETIMQQAGTRAARSASPPAIPDSTGVRVYVPRQASYPAVFLSIRTQVEPDPAGGTATRTSQVLEFFRRTSAADSWHNAGYADVGTDLAPRLNIALDKDGYAAFADGTPGGGQLSSLYTAYISALLGGHPGEANKQIQAGPLTDQFVATLQKELAAIPALKRVATFTASDRQDGIKLRTSDGGRFVLFDNNYDILTTPSSGVCITAGPGSSNPGSFASATDHYLQNVGSIVAPGADGAVSVVAESDNSVSLDTKPCTGGATI